MSEIVRIVHISDSHLGASMFQLTERREDVRKCLKKALEMAMRHSPDIIVHTGDLFHSHMPHMEDLNFVTELFKSYQDKAKLVVVQGNHDHPFGFRYSLSPIRTLENAGLILSTGNEVYRMIEEEVDGKKVELHLISWTYESIFKRILRKIQPKTRSAALFAHHIPISKDRLPVTFNYFGCGHSHNFMLDEEYDFGRPGSTCYVNWEREEGGQKKLIVVDLDNESTEYQTESLNDVREFKFVTGLNITGMGPKEADETIRNALVKLSPKKKDPIIILKVNGTIDSETEDSLKRDEIIEYGEQKLRPLFLHLHPNWDSLGPRPVDLSEPLNVEESVREYIEQTGDLESDPVLGVLKEYLEE